MRVTKDKISWWRFDFDNDEIEKLSESIRNKNPNMWAFTEEFEQRMAEALEVSNVVATTSGSIALLMSLMALGIKAGDEVIVPNRTWIATAHAPMMLGAKVILVDVLPDRPVMDTSQVRKKINSRTKAIMPASLCGCAVELEEVWQIASEHKLFVVEDVAQGLFSKYQGKFMGTKSDAGCFSMATSKLIWTGQGGLVVTQNNELSRHLRLIRSHGVESALDATPYLRMGFNFKFSEFHALIGLVQMQRVQERINSLKAIYQKYREALLEMDWIKLIPVHVENGEIPLYVEILVEEREKLMGYLESRNIQTRRIYPDLDSARHLGCHEDFPNARVFAKQGMVLPCGPDQPKEDVERVLETLKLYSRLK